MAQYRSLSDKIADARRAYEALRDDLTSDTLRAMGETTTKAQAEAAEAGDISRYAAWVDASINVQRVIAANDRAAMIAAVMLTQSGVSRPQLDVIDGGE